MKHSKIRFGVIRNSLVLKIILMVFLVTWPAVIGVLAYSTFVTQKSLTNYSVERSQELLDVQAQVIERRLEVLHTALEANSKSSQVTNYLNKISPQGLNQVAGEIQISKNLSDSWKDISVANSNGIVQVTTDGGYSIGDSLFGDGNITNKAFSSLKNSNKQYSLVNDNGQYLIVSLFPVMSENQSNKVIGYVSGITEVSGIRNYLSKTDNLTEILVLSNGNNSKIIFGANDIMNGITSEQVLKTSDVALDKSNVVSNNEFRIIAQPVATSGIMSDLNIRIVGILNNQPLLDDIASFRLGVYIFAAVVLFIANLILIIYLNRSIAKPLDKLKVIAQQIAAGDLSKRAPTSDRADAIGRLQYATNDMAMSLINQQFLLEKKVKQQTHKLSEQVDDLEKARSVTTHLIKDLSKTKEELEVSKEQDESLLASIGDGVFAINTKQEIILFNKAAERITGYSEDEVIGRKYSDKLHFEVKSLTKHKVDFIDKSLEGKSTSMPKTTYIKHKKGHLVPIDDSSSPVFENRKVTAVIVVFRDITKELRIDTAKTEFVSLASHQLRTPLTAINWYSELLLKDKSKGLNAEQKKYLKEIAVGNQRMIELVNALLNISRLEVGSVAIDPSDIDVNDVLKSIEDEVHHSLVLRKQHYQKSIPKTLTKINTDPNLLRIVLQNLYTNAIKYTPERGTIKVAVEHITKAKIVAGVLVHNNTVLISVKDNGFGIPSESQNKIFSKMFRADNIKEKNVEGTGLGLYMCSMLTKILRGKLWFASSINKGSTFYLQIPVKSNIAKVGSKKLEG